MKRHLTSRSRSLRVGMESVHQSSGAPRVHLPPKQERRDMQERQRQLRIQRRRARLEMTMAAVPEDEAAQSAAVHSVDPATEA